MIALRLSEGRWVVWGAEHTQERAAWPRPGGIKAFLRRVRAAFQHTVTSRIDRPEPKVRHSQPSSQALARPH
jgi:hypothetical protein